MSNNDKNTAEREAVEALLPWYESGQLDADDAKRVDAYLADHPDMAHQLALIGEERVETTLLNEARGTPRAGSLDRLMESIQEHEAANPSLAATKKAVWGWASRLVGAPVPAGLRWVAAAAAILIVAQGVTLGVLMTSGVPRGPGYETASGPGETAEKGTFALVQFADGARAEDINRILTDMGLTIVGGPKPGGVYRVRISDEALDDAKRDTILKKLSAQQNLISFAAPSE